MILQQPKNYQNAYLGQNLNENLPKAHHGLQARTLGRNPGGAKWAEGAKNVLKADFQFTNGPNTCRY
jgi:hypothetical protein